MGVRFTPSLGSERDKLLRLVNTNGAPFYGSQIQRMPELGPDFVAHIARLIEAQWPDLQPVDTEALAAARSFLWRRWGRH